MLFQIGRRTRISNLEEPTCHSSSQTLSIELLVFCCGLFLSRSSGGGVHCTLNAQLVRIRPGILFYSDVGSRTSLIALPLSSTRQPVILYSIIIRLICGSNNGLSSSLLSVHRPSDTHILRSIVPLTCLAKVLHFSLYAQPLNIDSVITSVPCPDQDTASLLSRHGNTIGLSVRCD